MAVAMRERVTAFRTAAASRLGARDLSALCASLEQRLAGSQERIRVARQSGRDVQLLEQRWRELLRAYERLSDLQSRFAMSVRTSA